MLNDKDFNELKALAVKAKDILDWLSNPGAFFLLDERNCLDMENFVLAVVLLVKEVEELRKR